MIRNFAKAFTMAAASCLLLSACNDSKGATGPEATLPLLQKWSFSGNAINYKSGIAVRSRDTNGKLVAGLTIWLTDQSIDCSARANNLPSMNGGWIGIKYPEISLGKGAVRVIVGYWSGAAGTNGNIDDQGTATLAKADTANEKSVSGSMDFHSDELDPEDGFGKADVTGSYSVPYCPEL
jgi:hypothetical protein